MVRLATHIRIELAKQGMTGQELAKRSGLAEATVYELLRGERTRPQGRTLKRLADALGINVDVLVELTATQPTAEAQANADQSPSVHGNQPNSTGETPSPDTPSAPTDGA